MNMTMTERQEAKARDQFLGCSRPPLPAERCLLLAGTLPSSLPWRLSLITADGALPHTPWGCHLRGLLLGSQGAFG